VNIPSPDLLLRLRNRADQEGVKTAGSPPMGPWAMLASQPLAWRTALAAGAMLNRLPRNLLPIPALRAWEEKRQLPAWRGGEFRKWLRQRPSRQVSPNSSSTATP
jgi:L-lactate dehydrogenase complex protein LldF